MMKEKITKICIGCQNRFKTFRKRRLNCYKCVPSKIKGIKKEE